MRSSKLNAPDTRKDIVITELYNRLASEGNANVYQALTRVVAIYPGLREGQILYPLLGLIGELGEMVEKVLRLSELSPTVGDPPQIGDGVRPLLALIAKLGVVAEQFKKAFRGDGGVLSSERAAKADEALEAAIAEIDKLAGSLKPGAVLQLPTLGDIEPGDALVKEVGDLSWYLARLIDEFGETFIDVLMTNTSKLLERKRVGTLHGDGDERGKTNANGEE